jgi:hypothetical protein
MTRKDIKEFCCGLVLAVCVLVGMVGLQHAGERWEASLDAPPVAQAGR